MSKRKFKNYRNLKKGISLVIHTKNEEKNIISCINSAKAIVDEIVVIDMRSTDKTITLAKKAGARVFSVKDYGFADPTRNFGLSKTKYLWTLWLDADERLRVSLAKKLKKISKENKHDLVMIPHKNIIFGKWIKHTGWWPDYHIRFFKKGYIYVPPTVHFQIEYKGRLLKLSAKEENAILHYHHNNIDDLLEKAGRYSALENSLQKEKNLTAEFILRYIEGEFKGRYFDNKGYLDGIHGFVLSKYREFYRFLEFARYWESKQYTNVINKNELYKVLHDRYLLLEEFERVKLSKFFKIWRLYRRMKERIFKEHDKEK